MYLRIEESHVLDQSRSVMQLYHVFNRTLDDCGRGRIGKKKLRPGPHTTQNTRLRDLVSFDLFLAPEENFDVGFQKKRLSEALGKKKRR